MPFTDPPNPSTTTTTTMTETTPSHADLAAVAATVSVVGILMALLITWLVLRLRRCEPASPIPIVARRPTSNATYIFRPSFAPSESSSKFGFTRKSLHLSRKRRESSWDFADPDPFLHAKESPFDPTPVRTPSQKHRPAPLSPTPAYTPRARRASTHKSELPHTPTTPGSADYVDPPPPAYCRDSAPWTAYEPKVSPRY